MVVAAAEARQQADVYRARLAAAEGKMKDLEQQMQAARSVPAPAPAAAAAAVPTGGPARPSVVVKTGAVSAPQQQQQGSSLGAAAEAAAAAKKAQQCTASCSNRCQPYQLMHFLAGYSLLQVMPLSFHSSNSSSLRQGSCSAAELDDSRIVFLHGVMLLVAADSRLQQ